MESSPLKLRLRRVAQICLGATILLAGVLLLAEGVLRLVAHASGNPRGMGFDERLGWRPFPEVQRKDAQWTGDQPTKTNSRGFRDEEAKIPRTPGERRIVALGDSMNFGQSVNQGERFTERLEQSLPALEVINLGVTGYGTDQQVLAYAHEGALYRPDLVLLITFFGNDLEDIRYQRRWGWPKPWFRLERGALVLEPARSDWATRLRMSSYLGEWAVRAFEAEGGSQELAPPYNDPHQDLIPLYTAMVQHLQGLATQSGALLVVAPLPIRRAPYQRLLRKEERLYSRLARLAIPVIRSEDELALAKEAGENPWDPTNHLTPSGHRLFATILARELCARGLL